MFRLGSRALLRTPSLVIQKNANYANLFPKKSSIDQHVETAYAILAQNPPKNQAELTNLLNNNQELKSALSGLNRERAEYVKNDILLNYFSSKKLKKPVRVVVTGASGAIGYALLPRIASGELLGADQPIHLHLLELPQAMNALRGVVMELHDCAFPLLTDITATDNVTRAFDQVEYAFLVGAKPRSKGMERSDLLKANAAIFSTQGKALNDVADPNVKVLVVGNPANTNAYIAARNAPKIDPRNFTAMTRLDHNRGLAQLSEKTGAKVTDIHNFAIWGNHSSTQYPDISHTKINGKAASSLVDKEWVQKTFIPTVQQRGAAIINQRGSSSAASAASSAIDHIRDWVAGTNNEWTSMAIHSDGSYGVEKGLYFSYPVVCRNGDFEIVQGLSVDEFSKTKLKETEAELKSERDAVASYIPQQ